MKRVRSDKQRRSPDDTPMKQWSRCPVCNEPFSESHAGPIPGTTIFVHQDGKTCTFPRT